MRTVSTRDKARTANASEAIVRGLSPDGGLYTPERLPVLPEGFLDHLDGKAYPARAAAVMGLFLDEFSEEELLAFAEKAYGGDKFSSPAVAPVRQGADGFSFLELFHGPTCAFKDMALQMLPHLLTASLQKCGERREAVILTATSGDTGKAALEGFRDVAGTRILVFYPRDGVSRTQELQMVTQEGQNVGVCAVYGNFDDAQTGVKAIFSDAALRQELDARGLFFSSANSINLGRLLPQVVYYVSAYRDMVDAGSVALGQPVHVCVPTGNFGNILSALIARAMGVPIGKLLCASNQNNVLTEFLQTGVYDRRRAFFNTLSPSMDILVSSNLERALFHLSDGDDALVSRCMKELAEQGSYRLPAPLAEDFRRLFYAGFCDDARTKQTMAELWRSEQYLIDPHTAVAVAVARDYRRETGDDTPMLVVSTASPFKFGEAVLDALELPAAEDPVEAAARATGCAVPKPLRGLADKQIRFTDTVEKSAMEQAVRRLLSM